MTKELKYAESIAVQTCVSCAMAFGVLKSFQDQRKRDKRNFYCPNGHVQSYTGLTEVEEKQREVERLQKQLSWANTSRDEHASEAQHLRRQLNGMKGQLTRIKNRQAQS